MTLRALIDNINTCSNGRLKARANRTASGIIVAIPSKKIEYELYDKDTITPGIWGRVIHFTPIFGDDDPWYTCINKENYDRIVNALINLKDN